MCGLNEQPRLELAFAGNWEFTEPGPSVHGVSQDRGGRVGGLWAAAGPEVREGAGSGMEERVGLSKAAGRAPSQLLPCQPSALLQLLGRSCPPCRLLDRVLEGYLWARQASPFLTHGGSSAGLWGCWGRRRSWQRSPGAPQSCGHLRLPLGPRSPCPPCCLGHLCDLAMGIALLPCLGW